jgi:hypothetical protein
MKMCAPAGLSLATLIFAACQDIVEPDNKSNDEWKDSLWFPPTVAPRDIAYTPETESGQRLQAVMQKQYESLDKMLDTISDYYGEDYIKALCKDEALNLEDFSSYFDASKTRTITDEYGNEYTTTLGIELAEASQIFLGELSLLKPDVSAIIETGAVYNNGILTAPELDAMIDTNNPASMLMLELKNAELQGADMETFSNDMNAVIDDYLAQMTKYGDYASDADTSEQNRAIYKTNTPIYEFGKIYYSWGDLWFDNIEAEHKAALKDAMEDWENMVNSLGGGPTGRIEFVNRTDDVFHQTFATIGLAKLRVMISAELPGTTTGIAIWGGMPGRTHLTLDSGLRNSASTSGKDYNPGTAFKLYSTARHELGHVLGLQHEHQRWDRDEYMTVPNKNANLQDWLDGIINFGKVKEFPVIILPLLKFKTIIVGSGWFKIKLPVPYFEFIEIPLEIELLRLADGSGGFDYDSIMLYSGNSFKMKSLNPHIGYEYMWKDGVINGTVEKKAKKTYTKGDNVPSNVEISENDAKTVKKFYESKWWQLW